MGHIISPFKEINDLHFDPIPTNRLITGKVAVVDGVVIVLTEKARYRMYTNGQLAKKYAFVPGVWPWTHAAMKALVKLKVIDRSIADQHSAICEALSISRSAKTDIEYIPRLLAKYGLELTEEQRDKIASVANKTVCNPFAPLEPDRSSDAQETEES